MEMRGHCGAAVVCTVFDWFVRMCDAKMVGDCNDVRLVVIDGCWMFFVRMFVMMLYLVA